MIGKQLLNALGKTTTGLQVCALEQSVQLVEKSKVFLRARVHTLLSHGSSRTSLSRCSEVVALPCLLKFRLLVLTHQMSCTLMHCFTTR